MPVLADTIDEETWPVSQLLERVWKQVWEHNLLQAMALSPIYTHDAFSQMNEEIVPINVKK